MPDEFKLTAWKGATFDVTFTLHQGGVTNPPWDLTGYTAELTIRDKPKSSNVLKTLTTTNGGIVLGGVAGTIELIMSAADTASQTWTTGVYDLFITSPLGRTDPLLYGPFALKGIR